MGYSLSNYEREVIITFNAADELAEIYTADPVWIRKLDKLMEQNPEQFSEVEHRRGKLDGKVIAKAFRFPKRFITIRSKDVKPNLTEEQRRSMAEKARARFQK